MLVGGRLRHTPAGAVLELRLNATVAASAMGRPYESEADARGEDLTIGGHPTIWNYQMRHGQIAEVLMVRGALSDDDVRRIEQFLLTKHGIRP
jgi:hypothetical protein